MSPGIETARHFADAGRRPAAGPDVEEIIVIGAGGHGREVAAYIQALAGRGGAARMVGFVDERKPPGPWAGTRIIGSFDALCALLRARTSPLCYITATGDNGVRRRFVRLVEDLGSPHLHAWTCRHPRALLGSDVEVGEGTCLAPGSIITTGVRIGRHCIVNLHASISHDCRLGDFVNVNPGAVICGNVTIGEGCYIGAGATVIDEVSIGPWTVIGAGTVVVEDLPDGVTAVGAPARVIRRHASSHGG